MLWGVGFRGDHKLLTFVSDYLTLLSKRLINIEKYFLGYFQMPVILVYKAWLSFYCVLLRNINKYVCSQKKNLHHYTPRKLAIHH